MKKYSFRLILVLLTALFLVACGPSEEEKQKAAETAAAQAKAAAEAAAMVVPKDAADKSAWQKYFSATIMKFMRENPNGITTNHPYFYWVPAGDGADQQTDRSNALENVKTAVGRGVTKGNLMAFGGPDSKLTSDLAVEAFKDAGEGSFKGVIVLFIGAQADSDKVKDAVAKSGAGYRFIELK
jgi:hypothetical protein